MYLQHLDWPHNNIFSHISLASLANPPSLIKNTLPFIHHKGGRQDVNIKLALVMFFYLVPNVFDPDLVFSDVLKCLFFKSLKM